MNRHGPEASRVVVALVAALAAGLCAGFYLSRPTPPRLSKADAPIEWNRVQAVPERAPDEEDKAWEERSNALDDRASNDTADKS